MTETGTDPVNSVIHDARKHLQDLQSSLQRTDIDYSELLDQLTDTSNKLKADAEMIVNERYNESSLIPLSSQMPSKSASIAPRPISPRENRLYKGNKAARLRQNYIQQTSNTRAAPVQRPVSDQLIVGPSTPRTNASIFPSVHIDIRGAAEAIKLRRDQTIAAQKALLESLPRPGAPTPYASPRGIDEQLPETQPEVYQNHIKTADKPQKIQNPRVYEELQDEYAYQTLLIVRGVFAKDTPDFESFQRTNEYRWAAIEEVLSAIENYCAIFNISYAEVDGRKLTEATSLSKLTFDDIFPILIGVDDQVFNRQHEAAKTIQNAYRLYLNKLQINLRKQYFWSAYKIQRLWRGLKSRDELLENARELIDTVNPRALELSQTLKGKFKEMREDGYVEIHVVTSPQDYVRLFSLMYSPATLIIVASVPPPDHVWSELMDVLAQSGINDENRINFIFLKGEGSLSKRLNLDMKSVNQVRRIVCGRPSYIVPHFDWQSERRLSVDINIPICGTVDTTNLQGRGSIKVIFNDSGVPSFLSTREYRDIEGLVSECRQLVMQNPDLTRWIVRLGFSPSDDSIAYFDVDDDFMNAPDARSALKSINLSFLKLIPDVGATIEASPPHIYSFPSVALFLEGDRIRVLGTFDRVHHSPFKFSSAIVPQISVDNSELISSARRVGSNLMRRGVIGYATVDFVSFKEDREIKVIGFDIRLNVFPSSLFTAQCLLVSGYDEGSGKMALLRGVGDITGKKERVAVVHNSLVNDVLGEVGAKEVKRAMFEEGIMFDLKERVGFRMVFFDLVGEGKGISITAGTSGELAVSLFEKAYTMLVRYLGKKGKVKGKGSVDNGISDALKGIRYFRDRIDGMKSKSSTSLL